MCAICESKKTITDDTFELQIDKGTIKITFDELDSQDIIMYKEFECEIEYCPFCGKRLAKRVIK